MSALTDSGAGVWSTGGNWNGGVAPVDGDTTIISFDKNLTGNATVGSSPATDGTDAIKFGNVTGKTLDLASFRLIAKGDIDSGTAYLGSNAILMGAGARITFFPPSGQQYAFRPNAANKLTVTANGTSGSHCTLDTDKSSSGLSSFTNDASASYKIVAFNLAYTDVSDFGTATQFGIGNRVQGAVDVSITHCTFTRSNFAFTEIDAVPWTGTLTFEDNIFSSSVANTSGSSRICDFNFLGNGTASIQRNGLDGTIRFGDFKPGVVFAYNAHAAVSFASTSSWTTDDAWHHNFAFGADGDFASGVTIYGPIRDCYLANDDPTNAQFFYPAAALSSTTYTRCLYEATNVLNDGAGDCIAAGPATQSVLNCIVLPTQGSGVAAGTLLTVNVASSGQAITVNHNTVVGLPADGAVHYGEGVSATSAGQLASVKSNLFVNPGAAGPRTFKVMDAGHAASGGASDVLTPSGADYNVTLNYRLTPIAGNSYPNAGNGYQGDFSATPGTHDFTISSDPFIDSTRNLQTWGTSQGTDGSVTAARDLLRANPSLIAQADTGAMDWTMAGYEVTGSQGLLLKDAGHDSVTIGAMEYVAASTGGGRGMGSSYGHRLLRP